MPHAHSTATSIFATLTALDWLMVIVLAWSTLLALMRGLIRELCSLVGLLAGVLLAGWYYGPVAQWLARWIGSAATRNMVAFLLIVLGVSLAAGLLGRLVRRTASTIGMGLLDRLAGGVFGFVRGSLIVAVVMLAIAAFFPSFSALRASRLAPYFLDAAHGISFVVPPDLRAEIEGGVSTLKHSSPYWIKRRR